MGTCVVPDPLALHRWASEPPATASLRKCAARWTTKASCEWPLAGRRGDGASRWLCRRMTCCWR